MILTIIIAATTLSADANSYRLENVIQPCAGLRGRERTYCLNAEVERGRRRQEQIDRSNRRLDIARDVACVARDASRHGATAVGGAAGYAAHRAGEAAGDRLLNNRHPCTPRAR